MVFDVSTEMNDWNQFAGSVCPTCEAAIIDGKCNCVALTQEAAPEPEPEEQVPAAMSGKALLQNFKNAPSDKALEAWKAEWGKVYVMAFDQTDVFVWRPLRRAEWRSLQANKALMEDEGKLQEQIVVRCVLWPRLGPEELSLGRAGFVPTIFNVIMQGSYFIAPEIALQLVAEL